MVKFAQNKADAFFSEDCHSGVLGGFGQAKEDYP